MGAADVLGPGSQGPLDLILSAVGATEDSLYEELLSPYPAP